MADEVFTPETRQFTVLIVDDTHTNILILKKTLNNAGYRVIVAENGPDGRKMAEKYMRI